MTRTLRRTALLAAAGLTTTVLAVTPPTAAAPTWLPATTISGDDAPETFQAQVATDRLGNATAVWIRKAGAVYVVQGTSRPAGGVWSAPVAVSDPTRIALGPVLAVDAAGTVTAAWYAVQGPSLVGVESAVHPVGGAWGAVVPIGTTTTTDRLSLGVDDAGRAVVTWVRDDAGKPRLVASSRSATGVWGQPTPVSDAGQATYSQSMTVHAATGVATAVWQQYDGVRQFIRASRVSPGGSWSAPVTLSSMATNAGSPHVAVDAGGTAAVAFTQYDGTNDRIKATSGAPGNAWSSPDTLSAEGEYGQMPRVGFAPSGEAIVAWQRYNGSTNIVQVATRPAGGNWSPLVPLSTTESTSDGFPTVVTDPTGGVYVAWWQDDATRRLQIARHPAGGGWGSPVDVAQDIRPSYQPSVSVDGAGDLLAVWNSTYGSSIRTEARVFDIAGPVVSGFTAPAAGTAKATLLFSAAATDTWSPVGLYAWTFGDGGSAVGASATHAYAAPGSYPVTLTVTDIVGNSTTRTATTIVAAPVPKLTTFKLTKTKIQALSRAVATKTKLKVRLNTAATLKLVFKSKHKHLVKGKKKYVRVVVKKKLPAGLSRITIKATVKGKVLKPDTYVITGTAKNTTGTSPKKKTQLKVVR